MSGQAKAASPVSTAYEPCSRCSGYGMVDYGSSVGSCPECGGNCYVRARDNRGRFTTRLVNTDSPVLKGGE